MAVVVPSESRTRQTEGALAPVAAHGGVEVILAPPDLLLVDDDEIARERLRLIVESAGYSVTTAGNGAEALKSLQQRYVPLLLTDVVMPVMGGLELCRTVRAMAFPSYLYTIVLSIRDNAEEVVHGLDAGADDYISKRATKSEMLARLLVGRRTVGLDQALRHSVLRNRQLADVDALTGSATRRFLEEGLAQEYVRSGQHGHWVSVLMCDLDNFKTVNDQWGHGIGDEVLKIFVGRVRGVLNDGGGWIGRYGGDEFVVVLPQTSVAAAAVIAERIVHSIAGNPLACSAGALPLTVSVGVTGVRPGGLRRSVSASQLLNAADQCMYESKVNGRNTITARAFRTDGVARRAPIGSGGRG